MASALLCASHTPLMGEGEVDPAVAQAVKAAFAQMAGRVRDYAPEIVIQFAPDHFNGFFYDLMPPFCVGTAAHSIGDWGTHAGPLDVPADFASDLVRAVQGDDIDIAISYRMSVDHGTTQIWEEMFGAATVFPIVPIFVNAIAPPLPSYRRARMLGDAVGRYAARTGKRVLFSASGGLSHDPPIPVFATAETEVRERLINGRNPTPDARAAREGRVRAAGHDAVHGKSGQIPLNPAWDKRVLALLQSGDIDAFDLFDTDEVVRTAGRAANETLAWVSAYAAHAVSGPVDTDVVFYEAIPGWIAGMAMLFSEAKP